MNNGHKPIGILAIQGDFAMHGKMLERSGSALDTGEARRRSR